MKTEITLLAATILTATTALAQIPAGYTVAPWHGFSESVVTYSLDDLTPNQIPVGLPLFDKYGVKASFNVITYKVTPDEWRQLKSAVKNGHEVTSHTVNHKNMAELSAEEFESECRDSKRTIQHNTGSDCITLVYPYCASAHKEISSKYYLSARCCSKHIEPYTPADMFDISSIGVGAESETNSAEDFNKWVDIGYERKGWCTFLIHAIDDDGGYSPIKSSELEKHLDYVTKNPQKFWAANFEQVTKYIIERDALTITETRDGNKYTVVVGCKATSPLTTFDEPITISRALPNRFKVKVKDQNIKNLKIQDNKIMFDVVPGHAYSFFLK